MVLQQDAAESMPGGLPGVQRQHQPPLWKLRSLRLLSHGDGLLQRDMHLREFGSAQLRRLRKRLRRIDPICNQGTCSGCPVGTAFCGGACIDTNWDNSNCGGCGIVCPERVSLRVAAFAKVFVLAAAETAARITIHFLSRSEVSIMERLDELSKLLAESVSRRESLRSIGVVLAGAVLSPLGVGTAWAARPDRCGAFCRWCPNKAQRNQCLAACRACNGNTSRLCGSCGAYRLLPHGDGLLQRDMHRCEFGSEQLRRLRKRLRRIELPCCQPGDMQLAMACFGGQLRCDGVCRDIRA